jgi:hypothetical protein
MMSREVLRNYANERKGGEARKRAAVTDGRGADEWERKERERDWGEGAIERQRETSR